MSGPSDVPAVVVERAPDGWTHIGGPGMHLLIGLDEDDDRTIAASDAADGGDLDDVIEVLTAGGMRKAHHFVGVHWQPRTRVVAFGPVSAHVTLADGTEHDVRATSSRVWTDLELPEHPERVVLRVLEESERSRPEPTQTEPPQRLQAALPGGEHVDGEQVDGDAAGEPQAAVGAGELAEPALSAPEPPAVAAPPAVPAQSASSAERADATPAAPPEPPKSSPWDRSWATPPATTAPVTPTAPAAPSAPVTPSTPAPASGPDGLRSWTSVRPPASTEPASTRAPSPTPSRVAEPVPAPVPAADLPAADDLPPAAPRDLESTWSARPVLGSEGEADSPQPPRAASDRLHTASQREQQEQEPEAPPSAPSYDYLFGHTTAADEHRRVLAQLTRSEDEEEAGDDEVPSVPAVADASEAAETNLPPAPEVPAPAIPAVADLPVVTEGGLISSVPWASPAAAAPEVPKAEPDVPTFSGRHTPPPPPSLLPPTNTPPPPPPPLPPEASPGRSPVPAPGAPSTETGATAYPATPQPPAEPTFDVPVMPRPTSSAPLAPPAMAPPTLPDVPDVPADDEDDDDDDAELTVDRSALLAARDAARNQAISGPSVLAVLCSAGHPTPPHSDRCRVCGAGIPPQGPFTMPRPPLGVLRLSTGDVVTLDRSVLLGRAPKLGDGVAAHDRPHVVKVPSPERDISRNHVEVILEGWHVLIRDLGTTNGTTVTLPGGSPVRLRANDQQVLEPGSLVSMADEVCFTFEAAL